MPKISQQQVFTLISRLTGQADIIAIPRLFVEMLDGDAATALFLAQLLYWTGKGKRPNGFIYKTRKEWKDEIGLSERVLRRVKNKLEEKGLIETALHRANGAPTLHYRICNEKLLLELMRCVDTDDASDKSDLTKTSNPSDQTVKSLTETTTETTNNTPPTDGGDNVNELPTAEEQAKILFGARDGPSWTVPTDAGGADYLGNDLLVVFCNGIGVDHRTLPPKKKRQWARQLSRVAERWQAPDDEAKRALEALFAPDGDLAWKSYSSPYQDGFVADFELYIGRGRTTQHRAARVLPGLEG